jgi:hypothetical protein
MLKTFALLAAMMAIATLAGLGSMSSVPAQAAQSGANKIASPSYSKIPPGGCCAKVHAACISTCNKSGGCTGKGDCVVLKSK